MADSVRTPSGAPKKRANSWLIFFLPVAVSAGLMFSLGAAFLWRQGGQESAVGADSERSKQEAQDQGQAAESLTNSSARRRSFSTGTRPQGERLTVGGLAGRAASSRVNEEQESRASSDQEVDWELEMADSEELEPSAEMIEQEREKIRAGKFSFGFVGRPAERVAEVIADRVLARRAERRAAKAGEAPALSESESPGVRGTAGAGPG